MKRTFSRGGVHPPGDTYLTASSPIKDAALPSSVVIPFSQHIGAPARPVVSLGDSVETAQIIAEPAGFISAAVHAPIAGTVTAFRSLYLPNGVKTDAAVIEGSGADDFSAGSPRDWRGMEGEELLEILKNSGVVGMGGATFPTHVKFSVPKGRRCETFIVNAAECEPYLSADHRLLLEKTEEVIEGILIVRKILKPDRVVVGMETDKTDALCKLKDLALSENIEVVPLKVKYPQGAEKNLIEALLGREVPSGKLPLEVGVINANVGTLFSIREAVVLDRPVIERIVTVAGSAVRRPGNVRIRLGSSIRSLLEECGGLSKDPSKLISGGPMMGLAFSDLDTPVTKGSSGILAFGAKEARTAKSTACLSCGRCVQVCPMGLSPTRLYKLIEHEKLDEAMDLGLGDCVLCGACAYVCPAHIPLVSAFMAGRGRQRRIAAGRSM